MCIFQPSLPLLLSGLLILPLMGTAEEQLSSSEEVQHEARPSNQDRPGESRNRQIRTQQVIRDEQGTRTQHTHEQVQRQRTAEGREWQRQRENRSSTGDRRSLVEEGRVTREDDGSQTISIQRSGSSSNQKKGVEQSWQEQVEGRRTDNALGGQDLESERQRTVSSGQEIQERRQRQTREDDGSSAFRENRTRIQGDQQRQIYREGRSTRRELADGYVLQSITRGRADNGREWTRESRETVRYLRDGRRAHQIISATERDGKTRYRIEEGFYTQLGNQQGWNYHATVEEREGDRVIERRTIQRQVRDLPFAAQPE